MRIVWTIPTILLAVIILALVGGYAWSRYDQLPKTATITRTASGFTPTKVYIKKGDTVRFVSEVDIPFWPASDSHPNHTRYAAFDPKQEIPPYGEWSFTFTEAGVWPLHDHMASQFHGTIFVAGEDGEAIASCLRTNTDTIRAVCWEADLKKIIDDAGLSAAFDQFRLWYAKDTEFQRNCHDVTHILGVQAFHEFMDNNTVVTLPETGYCGFGFYHGFVEEMAREYGVGMLEEGARYCDSLIEPGRFENKHAADEARAGCYHGMGHAIFDSLDGTLWGDAPKMVAKSIAECERLTTEEHKRERCGSGIFNALSIAYGSDLYKLSFSDRNPTAVCATLESPYRSVCYTEIATGYVRNRNTLSFEEGLAFMTKLPRTEDQVAGVYGIIDDEVRRKIAHVDVAQMHATCQRLPKAELRTVCREGILTGFNNGITPEHKFSRMRDFCALYPEGSGVRRECFSSIRGRLLAQNTYDEIRAQCASLSDSRDAAACIGDL